MKKLNLIFLTSMAAIAVVTSSCNTQQTAAESSVIVGSDIKLGEPIKDYKTFGWVEDIDSIPDDRVFIGTNGIYVFNNMSSRNQIKKAIEYELTARGFSMNNSDPDMLLNFMVLEQEGQLRTFNGYQVISGGVDSVRTEENVEMVTVEPGTLLISVIGGDSEGIVWQGYASGILTAQTVLDESKIKSSVKQIFNKFDYEAREN